MEPNAGLAPAAPDEFAALRIGPHRIWPPVVLAPMAGVTNAPFRTICRRFGAGLYVSEMVTARALVEGNRRSRQLASFAADEPLRSVQLYGTEPTAIGQAVRVLVDHEDVDHVDLNFGCPARKITRHGGGAALPFKRRLLAEIVRAAVAAAGPIPVTVKFRVGIDDDHRTHLDTGRIAEDEGCAAIALHARTASQLYSGQADWRRIAELKHQVRSIPVLGNGDIWEAADAIRMMRATGCDGVVVGRGCLGRPWIFGQLAAAFDGRPSRGHPCLGAVVDAMLEHAAALEDWYGTERGIRDFRKHTRWYTWGFRIGADARRRANQATSLAELTELLRSFDRTAPFPDAAVRMPRGHTGGPKPASLPDGWLADPDELSLLAESAEALVSGG